MKSSNLVSATISSARPRAVRVSHDVFRGLSTPKSTSTNTSQVFDSHAFLQAARARTASCPGKPMADHLSPTHSHLLNLALAPHLPPQCQPTEALRLACQAQWRGPSAAYADLAREPGALPPGHHLVYFPLQMLPTALMPDGTDSDHWPGEPFVRRMWAGGSVRFRQPAPGAGIGDGSGSGFRLDGSRAWCFETVGEPVFKEGRNAALDDAKVFVEVTRRYGLGEGKDPEDREDALVEETRILVFMKALPAAGTGHPGTETETAQPRRIVRAPFRPEFSFTLVPDAKLLFHFSALTYNAHAIHLDPEYARTQEGHAGRLVHGPLSQVLMLAAMRPECEPTGRRVASISYRNLAPLYVGEELTVCRRRAKTGQDKFDVWIEGPDGGLAVKGTAELAPI